MVGYVSKNIISVSKDDSRFKYWHEHYDSLGNDKSVPVALIFTLQDSNIFQEDKENLTPDRISVKELKAYYHITLLEYGMVL